MREIHGFELLKEQDIPELNTHARLFRHIKTGARLLSLENDDENKVFMVSFRTPPSDSTGVPHILEHSVLCGSRKYPLKDPFMGLAQGSLKTFLNAFTYPDKTCYPVASQNLQDFYNLIDVYIDAVFYPLIPPEILKQEGWRYGLEDLEAPLTYQGVVFNEMKGAYSSPDNLLVRSSQQVLFPDHTYGVDYGGDPEQIPNLTYEQFKSFHTTYYHPSNAYFFFYGGDDPDERLRRMDEYLGSFDRLEVDSSIPLQPGLENPGRVVIPYDAGKDDGQVDSPKKGLMTVNWRVNGTQNPETALAYSILAYILVGTPASPLRKALIDSGLGEDLTGVGLENELRQIYFSTGLKGIAVEDVEKIERLMTETLGELARDGIDPDMVKAAVNTVEFSLRENNTGSFPRGLVLMLRSLTTWLYDGDPLEPLAFDAPLSAIKERLASGEPFFERLIHESFIDNSNRAVVTLQPETEQRQREETEESEHLAHARQAMSREDLQSVIDENRLLKQRQETQDPPEILALIPSLKLADLDRQVKTVPLEVLEEANSPILYHDLFTNGIVYLDLGFNLHSLPQESLPYVPLFGRALLEMGTEREDYVKLSQRIGGTTGGIVPVTFTSAIRDSDQSAAWLFLRSKATPAQTDDLLAILRDVLLTARLDNRERFRQIVLEEKAGLEAQLTPGGHRVVNTRLRSQFGEAGWAAEQMSGVSFLFFLRRLAEAVDQNWPSVLDSLDTIRRAMLKRGTAICNVTLDEANWSQFRPELAGFLDGLPEGAAVQTRWRPELAASDQGLTIPAKVNYVGKGANLYDLGYELNGSYMVINNYLNTNWLYERVRLQGGAYGVFSVFDHRSGVATFLSYRDPNLLQTLGVYDQAGGFLRQLVPSRLGQDEIKKSIIGAIGDLDAYQLPDARGYTSLQRYLVGDTDESRQRLRDQVLSTSLADFRAFGEVLDRVVEAGRVVVLGSKDAIDSANASRTGWLDVQKVL